MIITLLDEALIFLIDFYYLLMYSLKLITLGYLKIKAVIVSEFE